MQDTPRRLQLRVVVKLLFLIGISIALYILFASTGAQPTTERALPPLRVSLTQIENGSPYQRLPWQGGNLILLRRSPDELAQLTTLDQQLLDPGSSQAHQPDTIPSPTRSLQPELFIAFDRGTDLGCPLRWIAATSAKGHPVQPWPGGFRDSCDGSWYDSAGRVFKGQRARRNLDIPTYRVEGDLLEIGSRGDNHLPAN